MTPKKKQTTSKTTKKLTPTTKAKTKPASKPSIKKPAKTATPKVTVTPEDLRETRYFAPRNTPEEDIERIAYGIKKQKAINEERDRLLRAAIFARRLAEQQR